MEFLIFVEFDPNFFNFGSDFLILISKILIFQFFKNFRLEPKIQLKFQKFRFSIRIYF